VLNERSEEDSDRSRLKKSTPAKERRRDDPKNGGSERSARLGEESGKKHSEGPRESKGESKNFCRLHRGTFFESRNDTNRRGLLKTDPGAGTGKSRKNRDFGCAKTESGPSDKKGIKRSRKRGFQVSEKERETWTHHNPGRISGDSGVPDRIREMGRGQGKDGGEGG